MSKVSRAAEVLHVTEPEAREFCLQVQKCFKNHVPKFPAIASAIVSGQGTIKSPDEIAKLIEDSRKGIMDAKKPKGTGQASSAKRLEASWKRGVRKRSGWRSRSWDEPSIMRKESGLRSVHFDRSRVAIDELEKCPHGVPKLQLCAICNPEEFHEMAGVD
jgi:hypothetical protein